MQLLLTGASSRWSARQAGALVARALVGTWRREPPAPDLSPDEILAVTPQVLAGGAAGLVCRRLGRLAPPVLRQAYRLQVLLAAMQEARIESAFAALRARDIEPILGKGWAVARAYAEEGLRPTGDIDLYVPRGQARAAEQALAARGLEERLEDVHDGFAEIDDVAPQELLRRSRLIALGRSQIRVFGPEDHLRLVALHALRHGILRAQWLCDVAALLENQPEGMDRRIVFGGPRAAHALSLVIGLAAELLGARPGDLSAGARTRPPSWAVRAVLDEWGAPRAPHGARTAFDTVRSPQAAFAAIRLRWPNALEAAAHLGAFQGWSPSVLRLASGLSRAVHFARRGRA